MPNRAFRRSLHRLLPGSRDVEDRQSLRLVIGQRLRQSSLWHLNRRSVSGGVAVGLFWTWMPMPMQMIPAAVCALLFRVNLPLALVTVWVSNPVTMGPMLWFAYQIGAALLGIKRIREPFEPTLAWFLDELGRIWEPLLLGSVLLGSLSALTALVAIRMVWRYHIVSSLLDKRRRRRAARQAPPNRND